MAAQPGDIYWASDYQGGGRHRVVVVSREELNRGRYLVTVMFTSKRLEERKLLPNCVFFPAGTQPGLDQDCVAQCESIAQVPIETIRIEEGLLGQIPEEMMFSINKAINYVIDSGFC